MERGDLNRRDWICRVMQAAAAGAIAKPAWAHAHEHGSTTVEGGAWRPLFLNPEQNESLVALGEQIIPGSKEAQCNRVIDLVLSIESNTNKAAFQAALNAFEQAARKEYDQPLQNGSVEQLDKLLAKASSRGDALEPHFHLLKEWFADSYWSSQQGLKDLGWTGRVAWSSFDGCQHGGAHT